MIRRDFPSYDEYVYRQGGKARKGRDFLLAHLEKKTGWYAREFTRAAGSLTPGSILCLGARTGAENLGAIRAGFPGSMGIDLHPVGPSVAQGDWHDIPFATGTFENVYCNSLDHCLYLDKFTAEVKRVLTPNGRFYLMATNRSNTEERWFATKGMEALYWHTSDELRDAMHDAGFYVTAEWRKGKWGHYVFGVTA